MLIIIYVLISFSGTIWNYALLLDVHFSSGLLDAKSFDVLFRNKRRDFHLSFH